MASILVLEDHDSIRENVTVNLESEGHTVTGVCSGAAALELLTNGMIFDLVLTDYRMEGMDGIEFVCKLKSLGHSTPVIIMSASRGLNCAADFIINKPFDLETLMAVINRALACRETA